MRINLTRDRYWRIGEMGIEREIENRCTLKIVREIASGGMGTVSEAIQIGAGGFAKRVAIKEILQSSIGDESCVEMLMAEAKLVANLVHENIIQIYQLNQSRGGYYIVMEYVNGLPLSEFIQLHHRMPAKKRIIPTELAVFITSRIARGLAYAHRRTDPFGKPLHIVHRDVCPKNIMVTTEGLPKLGDFGIAFVTNQQASDSNYCAIGKFGYMAPEQAASGNVDFRADIYSLGLVLFELLTMSKCRGKWSDNLMMAAVNGWIDWDLLPRSVPKALRKLLEKMLASYPSQRFESTDELAQALEMYIYGKGYGPTVVTLEKYLRELAPSLYDFNIHQSPSERRQDIAEMTTAVVDREESTRVQ